MLERRTLRWNRAPVFSQRLRRMTLGVAFPHIITTEMESIERFLGTGYKENLSTKLLVAVSESLRWVSQTIVM